MKAQKALSGGGSKGPTKQMPLLQPLQPRVGASHGPGDPPQLGQNSPYAQLLPRPSVHSPQSPYPPNPYQGGPHQNQEYPAQNSPGPVYEINPPGSAPLHPAIRPQYGAPWSQHASLSNQHNWSANPQTSTPTPPQPASQAPGPAKLAFAKQSHSPIPLPPYVRQMATAPPSNSKSSPPSRPPGQAASSLPAQNPFKATSTQAQSPGQAPSTPGCQGTPQQGQWPGPGSNTTGPPAAVQASPAQQQSPHYQISPGQSQPAHGGTGSGPVPRETPSNDNSERAMVEKMMLNLRRASAHFETVDTPQQ